MMRANINRLIGNVINNNLSGLPDISIKFSGTIFTSIDNLIYIIKVVNLKRVELLTYRLEICCSIQLSYKSRRRRFNIGDISSVCRTTLNTFGTPPKSYSNSISQSSSSSIILVPKRSISSKS